MTILDDILSNNVNHKNEIPNDPEHFSVLSPLFSWVLKSKEEAPKYIYKTFFSFANNEKSIKINLTALDRCCANEELISLLFSKLVKVKKKDFNGEIESESQNVMKAELFKLFKNVQYLEIYCPYHPFALLVLQICTK